ncbi:putative TOM core complex subunit Tom6 [Xylariales sp. PMI_506]|nr:putative TOM core complex subunit Tom6 [Xylariales sp. PMI_506]
MAPKGQIAGRPQSKGLLSSTYEAVTSPENASVVRSVAVFGATVAFLYSSWAEFLLPP